MGYFENSGFSEFLSNRIKYENIKTIWFQFLKTEFNSIDSNCFLFRASCLLVLGSNI
jgi:hypothetical protein